jgi:pimeloyl-ACP methyl ester carboxylesterase
VGAGHRRGTAVLVHGRWGRPEDWQWVGRLLEDAGVRVRAVDLPSHHGPGAGLEEDAQVVREAVAIADAPVVLVGWSYGTVVGSEAANPETVAHLVMVSGVPPETPDPSISAAMLANPRVLKLSDGTTVLDNTWWVEEEAASTFAPEVREYARRNPRRPSSLRTFEEMDRGPISDDWRQVPTTVLVGRDDFGFPTEADLEALQRRFDDVRLLQTDHFVIFRMPEVVAGAVLEALDRTRSSTSP